jgi:hypothetical protein
MLAALSGCSEQTAQVSGQVLYKGQPVRGGTVMFKPVKPGRRLATANLDEDGRYALTVAVGDAQILVDNRELAPIGQPAAPAVPKEFKAPPGVKLDEKLSAAKPAPAEHSGRYVEIPPRYYQFETADLTYTVRPEPQTHDIELK